MEDFRKTAEAAPEILKSVPVREAYSDTRPVVRSAVTVGAICADIVSGLLARVAAKVWGFDCIKEYTDTRLAELLHDTPQECLQPPAPNVAGPTIEALRWVGDEATLREMYAKLLAVSMDRRISSRAHPAFVEIIKQLTPDEARLLRRFAGPGPFPLVDIGARVKESEGNLRGGIIVRDNISLLGVQTGCQFPDQCPVYIRNLCRLALIEIPFNEHYPDPATYQELEEHAYVQAQVRTIGSSGKYRAEIKRKALRLTALGRDFCAICVSSGAAESGDDAPR